MPADPQRVKAVFMAASEATMADRPALLDRECGDDHDLRQRVEALLQAQAEPGSFLGGPNRGDTAAFQPIPGLAVGGTFAGRFKVREELGAGGMGVVFVADQTEPVQRRVALKVIRTGADSARVLARFEQERQALALMDHPNIAKVLDAGVSEAGQPYFVMELIKGVPLTKYCDEAKLTPRERLELFIPVCQAVQHAHQKGIIHRDLKPSNILVGLYDGKPVPKVIDFGVAKATGPRISENSVYTEVGSVIGTFEYMSPEQAELNNLDVDTRSDIYALGVILYELLTGTVPFSRKQLESAGFAEMLRVIKEDEPPKPSTRLSASKELKNVAASRHTEPAKLSKLIRGDLDWITMKALEKDRARRYETANGLARDIQRFLNDEPVEACPPSAVYRIRKFARKNRAALIAAGLVTLALLAGTAVSTWQAMVARKAESAAQRAAEAQTRERERAEENERRALAAANAEKLAKDEAQSNANIALAVRDFLFGKLLSQADTRTQADSLLQFGRPTSELERDPRISVLLDRAAAELTPDRIHTYFPDQPLLQAEILFSIGNTYRGIGKFPQAISHLERSRDASLSAGGANHPRTLYAIHSLAKTYAESGRMPEALKLFEKSYDGMARVFGPEHVETISALANYAEALSTAGRYAKAIQLFERVRKSELAHYPPDHVNVLSTMNGLASACLELGQVTQAIEIFERVRNAQAAKLGDNHPSTLATANNLAAAYFDAGRSPEATRLLEQVCDVLSDKVGPDHPDTLLSLNSLALLYQKAGRLTEAVGLFEKVRDGQTNKLGSKHPMTLVTLSNLATAYQETGRLPEALRILEEVCKVRLASPESNHPHTLIALMNLGNAYEADGRLQDAIRLYEQARDGELASLGPNHRYTLITLNHLGRIYRTAGKIRESVQALERVRDAQTANLGGEHPDTLVTLHNLAFSYREIGRTTDAIRILEPLIALKLKKLGAEHLDTQAGMLVLASAYCDAGRVAEAIPLCERARDLRLAKFGLDNPRTLNAIRHVGTAYRMAGRVPEAIRLLEQARDRSIAKLGVDHNETLATFDALASAYRASGRLPEAIDLFEQTRRGRIAKLGAENPSTLITISHLASAYRESGKSADAMPLFEEAARGMERCEFQHVKAKEIVANTIGCCEQFNEFARAEPWRRKWLAVVREKYGAESPEHAAEQAGLAANLVHQSKSGDVKAVEAIKRLIKLYDEWGKPDDAAKWRAELEKRTK